MRRVVHYTDDAGSPVNGTESVNDVWQGFRYDFFMLLSEIEKAELSRDAKSALCTELQYLLSDMSCGVEKMSEYADFMAKWREGFSETPVKENPVKKRRGKSETTEGGTAEGLFPDVEGSADAGPCKDAGKETPAGDSLKPQGGEEVLSHNVNLGEDAKKEVPDETNPCEDGAEGTVASCEPVDEDGTNLGEAAENEDSDAGDGEEGTNPEGEGETDPGEDAVKGPFPEDAAVDAGSSPFENTEYSTEEEREQAIFVAMHGPEEDEDEGTGTGKDGATLTRAINSLYGDGAKNGGAEGSPDNETED